MSAGELRFVPGRRRNRRRPSTAMRDLLSALQGNPPDGVDLEQTCVAPTRGHPGGTLCLHYKDGDTFFFDVAGAEYD